MATKFKIPTANFQKDKRGNVTKVVFPRSEAGQWNHGVKIFPIKILKIQLGFLFHVRVQSEAFNAGVVRNQHGRVIPEPISSSGL